MADKRGSGERATVQAVLFDAAGTLFNLNPLISGLVREELARHGRDFAADEVRAAAYRAIARPGWPGDQPSDQARRAAWARFITALLAELPGGLAAPEVVLSSVDRVLSPSAYRCYPDAIGHLAALRRAGARLALVSNFDDFVFPILRHVGLDKFFDVICTSYRMGERKPAPTMFRHALDRLAVPPARAVMVGDSVPEDVAGAVALGIPAVLIDRRDLYPGYRDGPRIVSFDELADVVPGYPLSPHAR